MVFTRDLVAPTLAAIRDLPVCRLAGSAGATVSPSTRSAFPVGPPASFSVERPDFTSPAWFQFPAPAEAPAVSPRTPFSSSGPSAGCPVLSEGVLPSSGSSGSIPAAPMPLHVSRTVFKQAGQARRPIAKVAEALADSSLPRRHAPPGVHDFSARARLSLQLLQASPLTRCRGWRGAFPWVARCRAG